ncbi:MAG: nucleotidyltransferase domain-containing protein [Syntrophomonadaceae bacterium]|nr:nucleotidyltransferase domain-containing protein [Syntrophomonadaceae bacterium]
MDTKSGDLTTYYKQKYPFTLKQDAHRGDPSLSKRYEAAWEIAKKAAKILKENYGARKVMVFGSLIDHSSFTYWSDIDLAAWDIPDEMFFAAVGAVTGLTTEFKIDLVDVSGCRSSLRNVIEIEGLEV